MATAILVPGLAVAAPAEARAASAQTTGQAAAFAAACPTTGFISQHYSTWTRVPSGPLFRGLAASGHMVVRIGAEWVMYYTELSAADGRHLVCYRRSEDLLHWSEPGIAYADQITDATGVSVTESPFVVERDGWDYLFIGPRGGYDGTDVLASRDPFRFTSTDTQGTCPVTPSNRSPTGTGGTPAPRAGSGAACTWPRSTGRTRHPRGRAPTTRSPLSTSRTA